ncbi:MULTISPECIES: PDR/VanB family oxidoreductase [Thiomicrorhabdus]|uniref:Oxidoreductase n=1 Tax=Thiomicrorhabdus heinhorstiae TaxID=2748010 RepID=A0ABS0BU91_9GAMM|nr:MULTISPECIES: PDR/VanB family oxidoreductase [Thiomicrorhabdus]MBF6057401.1 oxidoreductase [Thiomicrorhabdus heinhorstiae]
MSDAAIKVKVSDIREVAPTIREFTFTPLKGEFFPFSPGSHIVVEMLDGTKKIRNAYSLLSDPRDPSSYRIAVRLQPESRGGSIFMHQQVKLGDELSVTPPSNLFSPDWRAKKHLFLAGGVGITPFMSYIPEMLRRNADFELHYLYRSTQTGAYADELQSMLGEKLFTYDSATSPRADVGTIISGCPQGTHIYICGPESLIESVLAQAEQTGWPKSHIHYEAFAAPKPGKPFVVELKKSGKTVYVSGDDSMLEALEANDVEIPNMCRGGVCGQCITPVAEGEIEHRDEFLSKQEKDSNCCVMPCVSRAKSGRITLDI